MKAEYDLYRLKSRKTPYTTGEGRGHARASTSGATSECHFKYTTDKPTSSDHQLEILSE
jgi:hypothetical protein